MLASFFFCLYLHVCAELDCEQMSIDLFPYAESTRSSSNLRRGRRARCSANVVAPPLTANQSKAFMVSKVTREV
jgi:hypothetical protein